MTAAQAATMVAGAAVGPVGKAAGKAVQKVVGRAVEKVVGRTGVVAAETAAASAASRVVNPKSIRFSQDSIARTFKNGTPLEDTIAGLRSGAISPDSIPAIRVFDRDGLTFTLDNRRLYVFQQAGLPIRTVPATAREIAHEAYKFHPVNNGSSIRVRGRP